jgi:hypothetical protein
VHPMMMLTQQTRLLPKIAESMRVKSKLFGEMTEIAVRTNKTVVFVVFPTLKRRLFVRLRRPPQLSKID